MKWLYCAVKDMYPRFNTDLKYDLITAELHCNTVLDTDFQVALCEEVRLHGTTSDCLGSDVYWIQSIWRIPRAPRLLCPALVNSHTTATWSAFLAIRLSQQSIASAACMTESSTVREWAFAWRSASVSVIWWRVFTSELSRVWIHRMIRMLRCASPYALERDQGLSLLFMPGSMVEPVFCMAWDQPPSSPSLHPSKRNTALYKNPLKYSTVSTTWKCWISLPYFSIPMPHYIFPAGIFPYSLSSTEFDALILTNPSLIDWSAGSRRINQSERFLNAATKQTVLIHKALS